MKKGDMIRHIGFTVLTVLLSLSFMNEGSASLIRIGTPDQPVIYDDATHLYWAGDMTLFVQQNYNTQKANIAASTYGGIHTWQMATMTQFQGLAAAMSAGNQWDLIATTYDYPDGSFSVVSGRVDTLYQFNNVTYYDRHYLSSITHRTNPTPLQPPHQAGYGYLDDIYATRTGAWTVSATAPVPIPAAAILFSSGLLGLIFIRKKLGK